MPRMYTIDKHMTTEMFYCLTNDGAMRWRNQYNAIITNLSKKYKKGIFDEALAAKLFGYMVYEYEKEYAKEWGTRRLNKAEREDVARMLVDEALREGYLE